MLPTGRNTAKPSGALCEEQSSSQCKLGLCPQRIKPANQRVRTSTEASVLSMEPSSYVCFASVTRVNDCLGHHVGTESGRNGHLKRNLRKLLV